MKKKAAKVILASGVLTFAAFAGQIAPALADQGDCNSTSNGCVSTGTGGTGSRYRFATNDDNLSNNIYANGLTVNDNVSSLRKSSTSSYVRVCGWSNYSQGGSVLGYNDYFSFWAATSNSGVSSIYFRTSASC